MLAAGDILQDRYRIVRQLGKGGMGAVYEAVDQRLDATVALKETFSVDARLRRQFEQEARLLAQLHHSALPRVSDYFTEGDRAFLVMQFISGVDLAEIIARQPGPFPRNQVVAWADQLLDAIIYLHTRDRQIIHRDIKPHNLKLTASGKIALLDFGLAKTESADQSENSSASIFGYTRRYAPLEQIQDEGTTPQSDIYALGATLYHLLTGIKPVDAVTRAAALVSSRPDPLKPANEIHPAVGPEITAILNRAMAQNPDERFASASDFREALWRVGRDETRIAEPAIDQPRAQSQSAEPVGTTVVKFAIANANDPFDGYSILKPKEPDRFQSVKTTDSRVMAAVVILLFVFGVTTFYGYRRAIESSAESPTESRATKVKAQTVSAAASEPSVHKSKAEKPREKALGNSNPISFTGEHDSQKIVANVPNQLRERDVSRAAIDNASAPVALRAPRAASGRQLSVPNPHLPNAELQENGPAVSFQRLPSFGQPEQVVERQILRAPDGTQVVKFSDGTTRVFRPGEKIVQSGIAPK